jgi:hypothetical protein
MSKALREEWSEIVSNWDSVMKTDRKRVIRILRLGIPHRLRGKVWALLTMAEKAKREASFSYQSLKKSNTKCARIIDCDVPRSCPGWHSNPSSDFLDALRRILNAYAETDDELGYTQGMNFIAAIFLLYQDEETAFWSFYSLMHLSSIPHRLFFTDNFPKMRLIQKIIDIMMQKRLPDMWKVFQSRGFNSVVFVPQWFMVCFLAAGFDLDLSSFIFDSLLVVFG